MSTKFEDVLEAVKTIQSFCDEFKETYTKKMEPLKGQEIEELSNNRYQVDALEGQLKVVNHILSRDYL